VGIATTADAPANAQELIVFADLAMYAAKQSGKSRSKVFEQELRAATLERAALERDLRVALQRRELVLFYQPKVDLATLSLAGVEALVRWQHPTKGLLPPGRFIDIAEEAGLMPELGMEVLRLAAAQCRTWSEAGRETPIAVNVSPSQFEDPAFADVFLDVLRASGAPAHLISIEITESTAMRDPHESTKRLAMLREAGVRIAIDDFGIGYSNLSELSRMPVDAIKIDRSLVTEIGRCEKTETILRAMARMIHTLGYDAIAEGIETEEQHAFCSRLGCAIAQGYLYGRPMESADLDGWQIDRERLHVCRESAPVLAKTG
jgi:EAL domain-containing protein (putative c-di-GMP-specific phosphodiesterase class I)